MYVGKLFGPKVEFPALVDLRERGSIFQKMRHQTDSLRTSWNDDQFDRFRQDFDQDIMKKIRDISVKMEMFSKYLEEMCKIHRMAQQNKHY